MKVGPKADYPVKVTHEATEMERPENKLYEGIYTACLNYTVNITFVPDISAVAPPWDDRHEPDYNTIATHQQARVAAAVSSHYTVTPNPTHAGTEDTFEFAHHREYGPYHGTVFYVTPDEFTHHIADLTQLTDLNQNQFYAKYTISQLRHYPIIGFIEQRILSSDHLHPQDAVMLCRT